eukprot:m.134839 g.134839  ORF g.134839 m.134839 type:complete len:625 (-) comp14702_c0_seq1:2564-4438(-)
MAATDTNHSMASASSLKALRMLGFNVGLIKVKGSSLQNCGLSYSSLQMPNGIRVSVLCDVDWKKKQYRKYLGQVIVCCNSQDLIRSGVEGYKQGPHENMFTLHVVPLTQAFQFISRSETEETANATKQEHVIQKTKEKEDSLLLREETNPFLQSATNSPKLNDRKVPMSSEPLNITGSSGDLTPKKGIKRETKKKMQCATPNTHYPTSSSAHKKSPVAVKSIPQEVCHSPENRTSTVSSERTPEKSLFTAFLNEDSLVLPQKALFQEEVTPPKDEGNSSNIPNKVLDLSPVSQTPDTTKTQHKNSDIALRSSTSTPFKSESVPETETGKSKYKKGRKEVEKQKKKLAPASIKQAPKEKKKLKKEKKKKEDKVFLISNDGSDEEEGISEVICKKQSKFGGLTKKPKTKEARKVQKPKTKSKTTRSPDKTATSKKSKECSPTTPPHENKIFTPDLESEPQKMAKFPKNQCDNDDDKISLNSYDAPTREDPPIVDECEIEIPEKKVNKGFFHFFNSRFRKLKDNDSPKNKEIKQETEQHQRIDLSSVPARHFVAKGFRSVRLVGPCTLETNRLMVTSCPYQAIGIGDKIVEVDGIFVQDDAQLTAILNKPGIFDVKLVLAEFDFDDV